MAHWTDYSLRGWLSFLAFMHIGLSLRSFFDENFLYGKIFVQTTSTNCKEPIMKHFFTTYSIGQAFILIQAAIHLYVFPVQLITMVTLIIFLLFILLEGFLFKTLDFYGGTLLPFTMSVISLIWLICFHYLWKPWLHQSATSEDSTLKTLLHEGKKSKHKQQHNYSHQNRGETYYYRAPNDLQLFKRKGHTD